MKKIVSLILALVMLVSTASTGGFSAFAANAAINAKEVSLYYLTDSCKEQIGNIPSGYNKSFQLKVSGASSVSYSVKSGKSATVSSSGLIEPKATTWYWYNGMGSTYPIPGYGDPVRITTEYEDGTTVVEVCADNQTFNVTVEVSDYAVVYAERVMDDYIKNNVKSGMSDLDKVNLCAKFAADYDYDAGHSGAYSMIIYGGGDCWASTDAVIKMAKKMGFDAWSRNGNRDPGAGSGHMNAMVQVTDGTYYEVDAGYYEPAPRYYSVIERNTLFSYRYSGSGIEVYQYDGKTFPENLVVPDTINGRQVVKIGKDFISMKDGVKTVTLPDSVTEIADFAFNSCKNLESINLPASLQILGNFVFTQCNKLTAIKSSSPNFPVKDGMIYNKDKSILLYAPAVKTLDLPSSVSTIGQYALYYNYNIENVVIPKTVKTLEDGAFGNCENLKSVTITDDGLNTVGSFAFARCYKLERIILPNSVSEIKENAFYDINNLKQITVLNKNCVIGDSSYTFPTSAALYGYSGSELESYANKYDRTFVSLDNCKHTTIEEIITKVPSCTETGTKDVICLICGKVVKSNVTIAKIPHQEVVDVNEVKPTCTAAGRTKGSHCSLCGQTLSVSQTIKPLGHSYEWQSDNGMIVKKCSNCGDKMVTLPFTDLENCAFYGDFVEYTSVNNKFITGTNPPERTLFSPATPITRAMFVTILYRMAGEPYNGANPYEASPFTDITDTSVYYYNAACWALDKGITNQKTFKPYNNVTREQTASFLLRYAKDNGTLGDDAYKNVNLATYPDYNSVHGWALEAMQWANYNGMITGTQQGYINTQGATQRIHATKILYGFGKVCNIGNFA